MVDHLMQHLEPGRIQAQKWQSGKKKVQGGVLTPKDSCAWCQQQLMGPEGPLSPPAVGVCAMVRGQAGITLLGAAGLPGCRQSLNSTLGTVNCKDLLSSP